MNYSARSSKTSVKSAKLGSFVSLKDYIGDNPISTNPYASIDDFLDETWNLEVSSSRDTQESKPD